MRRCNWILWSLVALFAASVNNIASASATTLTCTLSRRVIDFHEDKFHMLCEINDQTVDAPNITIATTGDDHLVNDFGISKQPNVFFLPDRIGERFPNLIFLGSRDTKIRSLQRSNFVGFTRLRSLYVTDSDLEKIEHNAFEPLENLWVMGLSNNKIKSINPAWFVNKQSMTAVHFSNNKIESITHSVFDELPSLRVVWLHGNPLKRISAPLFLNNNQIRELQLFGNPLEFISDTAFDGNFSRLLIEARGSKCLGSHYPTMIIPEVHDWKRIVRQFCNGTIV